MLLLIVGRLTKVSNMPHGVNSGVMFVENDEQWGGGDALCQRFTVQILPEEEVTHK